MDRPAGEAVSETLPDAHIIGRGEHVAVMKGVGHPMEIAAEHGLRDQPARQGLSHTRMATESAVTAGGSHPFSVADDLCLVHNGSFSNHATIRRGLRARRRGVRLRERHRGGRPLRRLAPGAGRHPRRGPGEPGQVFDGFYTLVVTTADSMAVVRDPIACKPAIIAETDDYVAMASEYRALAGLPGIENARIFEPEPGKVYTWSPDSPPEAATA